MVADVLVLGAGGHGLDVCAIARAAGIGVVGFLDDNVTDDPENVIGKLSDWDGQPYLLGVNDSTVRERIHPGPGECPVACHPSASVHHSAVLGPGSVVGANSTLGPQVTLGQHVHVNGNTFITRAMLASFVTVGPGVTICGDVMIGKRTMIGAGATVSNLSVIGADVTIGAGAVVLPGARIPNGETWVGVPARPVVR